MSTPLSHPRRWVLGAAWQALVVVLSACSIGAAPPLPSNHGSDAFVVNEKSLAFNTTSALAAFNSPPTPTYQIGPGDKLKISVWERPELSGQFVVGPDGYIGLPVAGPIKLAGLGREETHQQVTNAFSQFYEAPIVTVDIEDYVSNRILILGRVTNPGAIQFINPPTLLETITLAGGLPVGGLGSEKATLTRCAVFRGRDRVVWLNLKDLLAGRNLALNLQLRSGDLVYIPDADDQLVYALGEVNAPGAYNLSPEMTLLDIVARAGGLTENGDPSRLTLVRPSENASMNIRLKDLLEPDPSLNVSLAQGDVLYVPTSELGRVGYVMTQIAPFTSFLLFTQGFSSNMNNEE
jgi:polysaccharide export outer membrane protein